MSAAVAHWRWRFYAQRLGDEHPRVRALFGRYVAARGGWLSLDGSGHAAWVANRRAHGCWIRDNRSQRKHRLLRATH